MIILIPSFEPDGRLLQLVGDLRATAPLLRVVVVDDGSGPAYADLFAAVQHAGADVIGYDDNRGKGHALKFGFRSIRKNHPGEGVVCADSDGQHTVGDILRVVAQLQASDGAMVLGGRAFAGDVPTRSRFGNAVSRSAFKFATGVAVRDTQTGLRGYPATMLDWLLGVKGERFEYELNALLGSRSAGIRIEEIEIETVYLQHNASSHFRPIVDSVKVFAPLLRYISSSLAAFLIDAIGLFILFALTQSLLVSVVGARLVSASVNFLINRHLVFNASNREHVARDALRYVILALALVASSYVWLSVLVDWGVPLVIAKVFSDVTLYIISFQVQRRFVFKPGATLGSPVQSETDAALGADRPALRTAARSHGTSVQL
ncbi:bifunctional glycosyltransferase family 2/GtrA family protein [Salinibacterium sp. SWN248]|uniref:bifunctional glycosyltransferase family 2/GtrA family protein n=1 Tax=Salinibacterium sp. SWN248 TaxID=2792056 RepID=UPI0018CCA755|nr:bifunctional glycosyltransferase family 2/GtrA family protein [Salinibacterium sp. SWN248]MBH0023799.1 bifunctional glycosyltransferase family 2/GtrA family protein [Salinibacterium sp. SWN248]